MSEYEHVLPKYREAFELSDSERLATITRRWIDYGFADRLFRVMSGKLRNEQESPDLLICGESDMGKTTIIKRFMELYGKSYIEDECIRVKPALHIEVPKPNVRVFYSEILRTSIAPFNPDAPESKLRDQAVRLLAGCKTKMLIIDEIQVFGNGTSRVTADLMNEVKYLSNTLGIAITGVGMPSATRLLRLDPQYANRFVRVDIPKWSSSDMPNFQRFLRGFESWLPLKQPSKIYSASTAELILKQTSGNTGHVEAIILSCAREAIRTGKECIDLELLEHHKCTPDTFGTRELVL